MRHLMLIPAVLTFCISLVLVHNDFMTIANQSIPWYFRPVVELGVFLLWVIFNWLSTVPLLAVWLDNKGKTP